VQKGIKTTRYPYKNKSHYNTKWAKDGFNVNENGKIELSMGNHDGKERNPLWCMRAIYLWDTSKK
jgi:putative transposase